jgi:hypothetical protein
MERWTDGFEEDLVMSIRNWHAMASNWKEWRRVLLEAKARSRRRRSMLDIRW